LTEPAVETYEPSYILPEGRCSSFANEYVSREGKNLRLTCENDVLWMHDNGAGNYRLFPLDSTTFMVEDIREEMTFKQDIETGEYVFFYGGEFRPIKELKNVSNPHE
jgi:hypothetical protein